MTDTQHAKYLLSIPSVRERAQSVFAKATTTGHGTAFTIDMTRVPDVVDCVVRLIARDYGTDYAAIPPHGRWQHFNVGGVDRITPLVEAWIAAGVANDDVARRLLDLFVVSVLLDAGAGNKWVYHDAASGSTYNRSEGIAVASLAMFANGAFLLTLHNRFKSMAMPCRHCLMKLLLRVCRHLKKIPWRALLDVHR